MRAIAAFPSERQLRVIDHPEPEITRDDQVLVQMLDVGVCGTDREIARFDYGTPPDGSPYLVIGHESLARVTAVGQAAQRVQIGDLVVTMVRRPCDRPTCKACRMGRQDFCLTGEFTERGIRGRHGFMTERVVEQERYLHVVPEALREIAVLVEPLTIAEKALTEVVNVQDRLPWLTAGLDGGLALVLGAGPVGLLGALALIARGFQTFVYSREAATSERAAWVKSIGASYLSSADLDVGALASIGNIDLVYEATGASKLSFEALESLGVNGVFIFTGVPGRKAPITVDADLIMRDMVLKNQLIYGTVNASADAFDRAIHDLSDFYTRWPSAVRKLITARHRPEDAIALVTRPAEGIKHVVTFDNAGVSDG